MTYFHAVRHLFDGNAGAIRRTCWGPNRALAAWGKDQSSQELFVIDLDKFKNDKNERGSPYPPTDEDKIADDWELLEDFEDK